MADNNLQYADILAKISEDTGSIRSNTNNINNPASTTNRILQDIDNTLKELLGKDFSQSAARDQVFGQNGKFGQAYDSRVASGTSKGRQFGKFSDEFERSLMKGLLGSDFEDNIKQSLQRFADELDVSVADLPGKVGQELGKNLMNKFKDTKIGGSVTKYAEDLTAKSMSFVESKVGGMLGAEAGAAATSFAQVAAAAAPAAAAMIAVELATTALAGVVEGLTKIFKAAGVAANRERKSRERNLELANERIKKDINELVTGPFKILEDAANEVYSAWDNAVRVINQTQGYNKADLQDLMSSFAERLRSEGLSDVIAGTDIVSGLESVLKSGLSGAIAEEFAYQAVKLNAAIPTQDFFGYAATYSSIAANAVKDGKSQSQAIAEANKSLYDFSSNVLYASRELAGGFTTGLRDAQALYDQAVKIVQASRTGDVNNVSGVLTSVSAIVGAVAPDLASSITDAIYRAATGGNSSDIVALRSLAGINASNTEFLRALANDPQTVFANLFNNLATMFNDSSDAYMEKAEGYASLFGLSAEAFQRIDFNYLANSIAKMNVDNASLDQNLQLLRSGQSTQTKEQQKIAQINKYMIEEGLAYVLDNEVARQIQQHMWDEQMQREIMEATYGVELVGDTSSALLGIWNTVQNILDLVNPIAWIKKANELERSVEEFGAQERDIRRLLESGKVGQGNYRDLYNLTTRNADLNLTKSMVELFGERSEYNSVSTVRELERSILSFGNLFNGENMSKAVSTGLANLRYSRSGASSPSSMYSWGTVSKSDSALASKISSTLSGHSSDAKSTPLLENLSNSIKSSMSSVISRMISSIDDSIASGKSYEQWKKSGRFKDDETFSSALTEQGYTEDQLRDYFQDREREAGAKKLEEDAMFDKAFKESGMKYWDETFPNYWLELNTQLTENFDRIHLWNDTYKLAFDAATAYFQNTFVEDVFKTQWMTNAFQSGFVDMAFKKDFVDTAFNQGFVQNAFTTEFLTNRFDRWWGGTDETFTSLSLSNKDFAANFEKFRGTKHHTFGQLYDQAHGFRNDFKLWNGASKDSGHTFQDLFNALFNADSDQNKFYKQAIENKTIERLDREFERQYKRWQEYAQYYLAHKVYNGDWEAVKGDLISGKTLQGGKNLFSLSIYDKLLKVQTDEKGEQGDVIVRLARWLTNNDRDIDNLVDPALQSNALLAQILTAVTAIVVQNNKLSNGSDLPSSLSAKALGIKI